jgi:uncharacterized protein
MKIRTALILGLGIVAGSAFAVAQTKTQLSIATGGTGGVYYPLGGGFANILSKTLPNTTVTAEVTGGAVDNLKLIGSGKADIALVQVDAAWDAINGLDKFASGKLPITALVVMYPNHMHVVTVDGTGISKIEDLKGKRISTGSPGSATEVFAFRVLEAAGIDKDKDVKRERLGVAESVNAIKDKKIDAFFWGGGLPTAGVTDLAATPSTKIKLLDFAHLADKMVAKYGPLYTASVIPKTTYTGMDADSQNISVWNFLAVNAGMPEQLAYDITKTMMETRAELAQVHKEALNIKEENQSAKKAGVPWHPGAVKYFKEKGLKVD